MAEVGASMSELIEEILTNLRGAVGVTGSDLNEVVDDRRELITTLFPGKLRQWVSEPRGVKGSNGMGNAALVPWSLISDKTGNVSAQTGFYLVYLFSADGSRVYLSLNQGTSGAAPGLISMRSLQMRRVVGEQSGLDSVIDLASAGATPAKYERGNAYAISYKIDEVPEDDELRRDLDRMLGLLELLESSGLVYEMDPHTHLLLKWRAIENVDTIGKHKNISEETGSVWWGKFGTTGMSEDRIESFRSQLSQPGEPTMVYLVGEGTAWETRLRSITSEPSEVDQSRRPDYYSADQCGVFFELSDFKEISLEALDDELVLASDGTEGSVSRGLRGQSALMYVYSVAPGASMPATLTSLPKSRSVTDLAEEIGWSVDRVEWLLDSLQDSSPQVILSGPPGTGKTFIARAVSRFILKDDMARSLTVQFHPSYGYEEFVQGLRPEPVAGGIAFNPVDGPLVRMARATAKDGQLRILIVDEMNRSNLPRVFGELLFMLEYRDEKIDLAYEPDFSLPKDLLVIGTMNTADRSIRSIDIALRRRFDIFDCMPDAEVLRRHYSKRPNENLVSRLFEGFEQLNGWLSTQLDPGFLIGHSFFMVEQMTDLLLSRIWESQVAPILREYFYDRLDIAEEDLKLDRFF